MLLLSCWNRFSRRLGNKPVAIWISAAHFHEAVFPIQFSILRNYLTRQQALKIILNCKQITKDSETTLQKKLDYFTKMTSHKPESLVGNMALGYPYKFIVMRHEFLVRTGLFLCISEQKLAKQAFMTKSGVVRDRYFTPAEIVCTNDAEFLRKCTKNMLTLNELVTFEDMFYLNWDNSKFSEDDLENVEEQEEFSDDDEVTGLDTAAHISKGSNSEHHFSKRDMSEFYY